MQKRKILISAKQDSSLIEKIRLILERTVPQIEIHEAGDKKVALTLLNEDDFFLIILSGDIFQQILMMMTSNKIARIIVVELNDEKIVSECRSQNVAAIGPEDNFEEKLKEIIKLKKLI